LILDEGECSITRYQSNVLLEKEGDSLDRSCEKKKKYYTQSRKNEQRIKYG